MNVYKHRGYVVLLVGEHRFALSIPALVFLVVICPVMFYLFSR